MALGTQSDWKCRAGACGVLVLVGIAQPAGAGVVPDRATLDDLLGAEAITEDFESFAVPPGDLANLLLGVLDAATIVDGQGPGLVQPGAAYVSGSGGAGDRFLWMSDGYETLPTQTICAFIAHGTPTTLTIVYDEPVPAMGLDLLDYGAYEHTTTVSVFDPDGALLESVDLFVDGSTPVFFGYEAAAIGSVHLTGPGGDFDSWSTLIDNHTYPGTPAPESGRIADRASLDSLLGAGAINEDFETYPVPPDDFADLDIGALDATTVVDGQGPGLVEPGASYVSGSGGAGDRILWNGDGYETLPTQTVCAFFDISVGTTLTIVYDQPVTAMGMDLLDYGAFAHTTTVSVFDPDGTPLEDFSVAVDGSTPVFFGYKAAAIGSVRLTRPQTGWSTLIDNHTYGIVHPVWAVNEPGITDSELVIVDLGAEAVDAVGPPHPDADIEAMCYFGTQVVGAQGDRVGGADLVIMDFETGDLTFLADIDFGGETTEIVGMATDGNGVRWGYFENLGFATIEVLGAVGTFTLEIGCAAVEALNIECFLIEGLAVSPDGATLYAMVGDGRILVVDVATQTAQVLADFRGQFADDNIENLDLDSEGNLVFIMEDAGQLHYATVDAGTGALIAVETFLYAGPADMETIIVPMKEGDPVPVGACLYSAGACLETDEVTCAALGGRYSGECSDCASVCPADLDGDGTVGVTDFLDVLAAWGSNPGHPADLDGDWLVGITDFLELLENWGPCPGS